MLSGAQLPPDPIHTPLDQLPFSIHGLQRGIQLPNALQFSAGVERQLAKKTTLSVNYVGVRAVAVAVARRQRATAAAVRHSSGSECQRAPLIESAGRLEGNSLEVMLRGQLARKVTGTAQYAFGKSMNDTGGVNWYPANSFAPSGEWGRR